MLSHQHLPSWLHRVACGAVATVGTMTLASTLLVRSQTDSWLHAVSVVLLWLSVPIGIVFITAFLTVRQFRPAHNLSSRHPAKATIRVKRSDPDGSPPGQGTRGFVIGRIIYFALRHSDPLR